VTGDKSMTADPGFGERFESARPHLRAVAYRMLGSLSEADDVVQDAWLRANRADPARVANLGGWLTTIVARLCLDRLRMRASRREDPLDVALPDPVVSAPNGVDPEQEALLAESVGLAMLIVLETLTPVERLAFVLHDTFALPFDQIAPIVGRTPEATRQLASRARRRVRATSPTASSDVPLERQWQLVDAFLAAARDGDFAALLAVLDPDVVARTDAGAAPGPLGQVRRLRGSELVGRAAMGFAGLAPGARRALVNGAAGFVVFVGQRRYAVLGFTFGADRIAEIDILIDPARLASLDLAALGESAPMA
jgi:RNA polymerase sigma factor (sigma-70 family)